MSNMMCCDRCHCLNNVKKYISKCYGDYDEYYYCPDCCEKQLDLDEKLIKMSIELHTNINKVVKQEFINEYVSPVSPNCLFNVIHIIDTIYEYKGVKGEYVVVPLSDINSLMKSITSINKKLPTDDYFKKIREQENRKEEVERRRIEKIEEKVNRTEERVKKTEIKIQQEIQRNRHHNNLVKTKKEEAKQEHSHILKINPEYKIKDCDFCKEYFVFPYHFKNGETGEFYQKTYFRNKEKCHSICCENCFFKDKANKENEIEKNTEHCDICKCSYISYGNERFNTHMRSLKHKKNEMKIKGITDFNLLSLKELQNICSKSLNKNGTYLINNYTKMKKKELVEKMNAIKDQLIITYQ